MQTRLIGSADEKMFVLIFDKGDEVIATLTQFATDNDVDAASFTAIGAFEKATLGYYDREQKEYIKIPIEEQVEVLTLVGDISLKENGEPQIHAHAVVGTREGNARGGHVIDAHVWPTLEVVLTQSPRHLRRKFDPDAGIALIDLSLPDAD